MSETEYEHRKALQEEFGRAAATFGIRTRGRFDHMGVVDFSRIAPGGSVAEIGAGTGNFLALFAETASRLVAIDLSSAMLSEARRLHSRLAVVAGEGRSLPLANASFDLVACAQMIHHVLDPTPLLREMARVAAGRVLVVDQVAEEDERAAAAMTELETLRDPSHAASRPPSAYRGLLSQAGLTLIGERIVEGRQRFTEWMWPEEFPEERFRAVREFIDTRGADTGMDFQKEGDDYLFARKRMMLLAEA
ncbi:MAG: class I SAM-dependent methyltransferase [Actinomycetota bacterium]